MSKPYWTDHLGFKWVSKEDSSGMYSDEPYPCFMCGKDTHRIDINFQGYFCDSNACNDKIREELEQSARREGNGTN